MPKPINITEILFWSPSPAVKPNNTQYLGGVACFDDAQDDKNKCGPEKDIQEIH